VFLKERVQSNKGGHICFFDEVCDAMLTMTRKGSLQMNSFFKGVILGVGVGLLVAPKKGEEMRRLVRERYEALRANLSQNEQLNRYAQQVSDRVSQTSSTLKDYAQQAATRMKSTGSDVRDLSQQAGTEVKQTGQDIAETTKQTAAKARQSATSPSPDY
jgi:gas vesicle protein